MYLNKKNNNFFLGKSKLSVIFIITLMITSILTIPMVSADQLDQQNTTMSTICYLFLDSNDLFAQSFKPTLNILTRVQLELMTDGTWGSNYNCKIRNSLSGSDLTSSPGVDIGNYWVEFDFPDITVVPESTYYIVLEGETNLGWDAFQGDVYNRGCAHEKRAGDEWEQNSDEDFLFKTYGENNNPPNTPNNPDPSDGESDIEIEPKLEWNGGDTDGDTVYYDVYFGTDSTPDSGEYQTTTTDLYYYPNTLSYDTTYYWKIIAEDEHGATSTGPVWEFSTGSQPVNPPTAQTNSATNVGQNSAKLHGKIIDDGGEPCQYRFGYSKVGSGGWTYQGDFQGSKTTGETFSQTIYNLDANTEYKFRAEALNSGGSDLGGLRYFTTDDGTIDPPSVSTNDATGGTGYMVTLHGTLEDLGEDDSCDVWFVYDYDHHSDWQDYNSETTHQTKTSTGQFSYSIPYDGGKIYFRAVALNGGGTVQGSEKTFEITMELDPEPLDFGQMLEGEINTKSFEIWNSGDGTLQYSLSSNNGWITDISPTSGDSQGEHDQITVTIDTTGLSYGQRTGHIKIATPIHYGDGYDYPVKVDVIKFLPSDETLTVSDLDFSLLTKYWAVNDLYLDRWPNIPNDIGNADYGYYGHEANTGTGKSRAAIKEKFSNIILVPQWVGCGALLRATYTVPVNDQGTPHYADISLAGNCQGKVWAEDLGAANAIVKLIIMEGTSEQTPYTSSSIGYKYLKRYEVSAAFNQDDWAFNHDFTHNNNKVSVSLKEGQTYSFWVDVSTNLLLEGIEIPYIEFGYYGKTWSDIKFNFDSIKIDFHNPPTAPPEGEHAPEITNVNGPTNFKAGTSVSFTASANDADGDSIQYKWDWGDGSVTDWTTATRFHIYNNPGEYQVRVQAKDNSEYELLSTVSEPLEINVAPPDASINIQSPNSDDIWAVGTSHEIRWNYDGDPGNYVFISLIKEDNPDFKLDITTNPVQTNNQKYIWDIPEDLTPDDNYQILIWNSPASVVSDKFTVKVGEAPYKPSTPNGEQNVKKGEEYTYSASTEDPQGDDVYYLFNWGDNTNSGWLGPYESGATITAKHTWKNKGSYKIKVKAKDINDKESGWSDPLSVSMPKSKNTNFQSFNQIIEYLMQRFPVLTKILHLFIK